MVYQGVLSLMVPTSNTFIVVGGNVKMVSRYLIGLYVYMFHGYILLFDFGMYVCVYVCMYVCMYV